MGMGTAGGAAGGGRCSTQAWVPNSASSIHEREVIRVQCSGRRASAATSVRLLLGDDTGRVRLTPAVGVADAALALLVGGARLARLAPGGAHVADSARTVVPLGTRLLARVTGL